jgi:glycosyltransferase involved in cell wall biosynthesis
MALYFKVDCVLLLAANRRLTAFNFVRTIAVIHDLSQFNIPNKYGPLRMFYIKKVVPLFLDNCDVIHCISKTTLNDVERFYSIKKRKLKLNYLGFCSKANTLLNKDCKLPSNILYVARLESPGKNHIRLLRAYSLLSDIQKKESPLVFVGSLWDGHQEILEEISKLKLTKFVKVRGRQSRAELAKEYRSASLFVFPSLYEGFGIPLLEAMDYGVPVICSDVSSLPEVGGDAVLKFDPYNEVEIFNTIEKVLSNKTLAEDLSVRGRRRILEFRWDKHIGNLLESCYAA